MFDGIMIISGVVWFVYLSIHWLRKKTLMTAGETPSIIQLAATIFLILLFVKSATILGIDWVLLVLTLVTGVLWAGYRFLRRFRTFDKEPMLVEQARSFFPIILIIFLLRSFWIEPYRIPTGSLIPTLLIGDVILVDKYAYGVRLPISHQKVFPIAEPKPGDIAVFLWPVNPSIYFIKRVVGVPGDKIKYENKMIYRNGKPVPQQVVGPRILEEESGVSFPVIEKQENLNGIKHTIYIRPDEMGRDMPEVTVPAGHYFMMGDNRDGSFDSRGWGFVPEKNLIGKASYVVVSWNNLPVDWKHKIRWNRIWQKIH